MVDIQAHKLYYSLILCIIIKVTNFLEQIIYQFFHKTYRI
jgi:hypothetical protein